MITALRVGAAALCALALIGCGPRLPPIWHEYSKGGEYRAGDAARPTADNAMPPEKLRGNPQGEAEAQMRVESSQETFGRVMAQAERGGVIVTTGPIHQDYRVLGPVHAEISGTILWTVHAGTVVVGSSVYNPVGVSLQPAPPAGYEQINQALREVASQDYDVRADAVINVTYQAQPNCDLFADGIAVQFLTPKPPAPVPPTPTNRF